MTTTYRGYVSRGGYGEIHVTVQRGDGPEEPLRHHVLHSPSGFAWGYGGSGPSDLARCILIDHRGLHRQAESMRGNLLVEGYQDFKAAVIAGFPWGTDSRRGEPVWTLTSEQINEWAFDRAQGEGRR